MDRADAQNFAGGTGDFAAHTAAHELPHRLSRAQELSREIDGQDLVPLSEGELVEGSILLQAGVVDQDVHRAELFQHGTEHRAHLGLIRHVGAQSERPRTLGANRLRQSFGLILIAHVVDDDISPGIAE
jgi:hypothetical protein